jgi:hypothetical protein
VSGLFIYLFIYLFLEAGSFCVAQVYLKTPGLKCPSHLSLPTAGTVGTCHHVQLDMTVLNTYAMLLKSVDPIQYLYL